MNIVRSVRRLLYEGREYVLEAGGESETWTHISIKPQEIHGSFEEGDYVTFELTNEHYDKTEYGWVKNMYYEVI
jgi:hypothetical protein